MRTNRFAAILRVLTLYGPSTPHQIAERIGIPYKCLYGSVNYLARMVEAEQIHILAWDRQEGHGGPPIPVYAAGPGKNAKRPKSLRALKLPNKYQSGLPIELSRLLGLK